MRGGRATRAALLAVALAAGCDSGAPTSDLTPVEGGLLHEPSGIVLVRVPAARLTVGTPAGESDRDGDEFEREVEVDAFLLGETEVTVAQWRRVMGAEPPNPAGSDELPAGGVTWHEAKEFVARLNASGSRGWRLPTEEEWEHACRAGTTTPFSFGATITTDQVNYDGRRPYGEASAGEYRDGAVPVKSFPPNAFGLYEMHGNLFEWCEEVYVFDPSAPPPTLEPGTSRVIRGGAFSSRGKECRSGYRDGYPPHSTGAKYGFRVARDL